MGDVLGVGLGDELVGVELGVGDGEVDVGSGLEDELPDGDGDADLEAEGLGVGEVVPERDDFGVGEALLLRDLLADGDGLGDDDLPAELGVGEELLCDARVEVDDEGVCALLFFLLFFLWSAWRVTEDAVRTAFFGMEPQVALAAAA